MVAQSQIGFIDFIVEPTFSVLTDMSEKIVTPLIVEASRPGTSGFRRCSLNSIPSTDVKHSKLKQTGVEGCSSINSSLLTVDVKNFKSSWNEILQQNREKWKALHAKDAEEKAQREAQEKAEQESKEAQKNENTEQHHDNKEQTDEQEKSSDEEKQVKNNFTNINPVHTTSKDDASNEEESHCEVEENTENGAAEGRAQLIRNGEGRNANAKSEEHEDTGVRSSQLATQGMDEQPGTGN